MLEAKDQNGQGVDWWFIYKTPKHTGSNSNQGFEFLYFDNNSKKLTLSPTTLDNKNQALSNTLNSVFDSPKNIGFIVYNDEHADKEHNSSEKGHCKGMLAFDKSSDSALLLLHSTPRFPAFNEISLPEKEAIYGQTFICVSLPNYDTANKIAAQMGQQQNPQILIESSRMPESVSESEAIYRLFHDIGTSDLKSPSSLEFNSRGGKEFKLIAKSRKWGKDFWLDLVSPELRCDLIVESWRRGKVPPEEQADLTTYEEDTLDIKFTFDTKSYEWHYTKDHAKWAVALKNKRNSAPWICVADLNRMVSQEKRGGGSLCFQDEKLWQALRDAEEHLHKPNDS